MIRNIEKTIIENARSGDSAAFTEIYYALRGLIYGFSYRMLGEQSLAEDATQETFIFCLKILKNMTKRAAN